MMYRSKEATAPRQPQGSWMAGVAIGIAISSLATQAMMLGVGLAVAQAPASRLPSR